LFNFIDMRTFFALLLFAIAILCHPKGYAQTYTIPGATQQPAWVFPIYLEEGTGQRDTIYLAYDKNAIAWLDTIFGEKYEVVDTSEFKAFWSYCCDNVFDTLLRVKVLNGIPFLGGQFFFANGVLPLTIRWDPLLFYSDSLPFPDQNPAPRAQGEMTFYSSMISGSGPDYCYWGTNVLITDTSFWTSGCMREDSIVFVQENSIPGFPIDPIGMYIKPWIGEVYIGITENPVAGAYHIYPNPATDYVCIDFSDKNTTFTYSVFDIMGREILKGSQETTGKAIISTDQLTPGLYFVTVKTDEYQNNTTLFIVQ